MGNNKISGKSSETPTYEPVEKYVPYLSATYEGKKYVRVQGQVLGKEVHKGLAWAIWDQVATKILRFFHLCTSGEWINNKAVMTKIENNVKHITPENRVKVCEEAFLVMDVLNTTVSDVEEKEMLRKLREAYLKAIPVPSSTPSITPIAAKRDEPTQPVHIQVDVPKAEGKKDVEVRNVVPQAKVVPPASANMTMDSLTKDASPQKIAEALNVLIDAFEKEEPQIIGEVAAKDYRADVAKLESAHSPEAFKKSAGILLKQLYEHVRGNIIAMGDTRGKPEYEAYNKNVALLVHLQSLL